MKKFTSDLAVGVFALVALLIIVFLSLEVNDKGTLSSGSKFYYAHFDTVSGLVSRTPIEIAGIMVGYVDGISLDGNKAKVTLKIQKSMPLYKDAKVLIKDRGVLGDKYVALEQGTDSLSTLNAGDFIVNTSSKSDFDQLTASVGETAEQIKELLASDTPQGALGSTIVNIKDMTAQLNKLVVGKEKELNSIISNLDRFSKDLSQSMASNKALLNETLQSVQNKLGDNGSIDQSIASINRILAKIENGEGSVGKLLNDEGTVNKINDTIDGVNDSLAAVNDTVGLFRKLQLGIRYRAEYLTSDESFQNLIAFALAPSPDKYLLFELVDSVAGDTSVENTVIDSNGTVLSNTTRTRTNDNMVFNIQLAKRFGDLTLRAGMFRNTGGFAADYYMLKNQLVASAELFNASRPNDNFQLRTYLSLYLYKHFMLTGGFDDALSKNNNHNFFVGAGLRFYDNDIKAFIPALGAAF